MTPNPNENQAATCNLCDIGFPMVGDDHIPTQSLGMIPVTRCRKLPPLEKSNENQVEKHSAEHSPEPWEVYLNPTTIYAASPITFGAIVDFVADTFNCGLEIETAKANAARIVACVNFCAGVTNLEGFLPLVQMLINSRNRCNENVSLEAHLNVFREYVHELTGSEGEDDALSVLKRHVDGLTAELSTLRKELEAAKKNAGEVLNEMRAYCGECEFDDDSRFVFDRLKWITGELLNNGKDGK